MGRPVILRRVSWTTVLCAALSVGLSSCSGEPAGAPSETASAASAPGEMGEPHDQSAFGEDPSEAHLMCRTSLTCTRNQPRTDAARV
jgi:hypothetical protein